MPRRLQTVSLVVVCACAAVAAPLRAQSGTGVAATKHNLSASGPGPIKVPGETEICKFCHTPHAANPVAPLWNRADSGEYYETYTSETLKAAVGQPTGSSRLCLSCHDGTIALTETYNKARPIPGSITISPEDTGHIGTTLSDDHPVSFVYDAGLAGAKGQLRSPSALPPALPLDSQDRLQCTTCHEPHDDTYGNFLRLDNRSSQMCRTCHRMGGWMASVHAGASASVIGAQRDNWDNVSYRTVRDLACEACHRPHNAGGRRRLLRQEVEEDNCFSCHDGSVAAKDLTGAPSKFSSHPVDRTTGVHEPNEDPRTMAEHVECSDCHNPHQISTFGPSGPPHVKPAMRGASGLNDGGVPVAKASFEYEVCYKCHARRDPVREPLVDRVVRNNNIAQKFSVSNLSFHPVTGIGPGTDSPSLLQPLTTTSMIYCTDCHASDGPDTGPHGSRYSGLLVRNYSFENPDSTSESPEAYALCYGCHNRESILNDDSFDLHEKHLKKGTSCSACHDPHGVAQSTHLINFDRTVVFPSAESGGPIFRDLGFRRGSCTLLCHGENHEDEDYHP